MYTLTLCMLRIQIVGVLCLMFEWHGNNCSFLFFHSLLCKAHFWIREALKCARLLSVEFFFMLFFVCWPLCTSVLTYLPGGGSVGLGPGSSLWQLCGRAPGGRKLPARFSSSREGIRVLLFVLASWVWGPLWEPQKWTIVFSITHIGYWIVTAI